jgi:predicted phosphodiesterase
MYMSKYDLSNPIPSYLKSVVDLQIGKAKSLQNDNTLSFLFFTDPHITDASSFTDIKTLNYINNNLNIEFAACCGDNLDNAETKQQHLDTASKLIDSLSIEKFFTVKGNHDDNSIQSEGIDNIKHSMLPKEQYEIMFKRLEKIVTFDCSNKYGLYYYYDMPAHKVRAIFLNSIDIPYMEDTKTPAAWKYSGQSTYAYSNAQLNWLAHEALKLPADWKVMFFTHVNPFNEGMIGADNLAHNSSILLGIIDAFKDGTSYNSSPSVGDFSQYVSVDYSSSGKGTVIAFFYGHTHSEQALVRNGIKYISTWNDCPRKSASNPNAPARAIGTTSEICLNVVTVDLDNSTIYMTKFGAGDDLSIER